MKVKITKTGGGVVPDGVIYTVEKTFVTGVYGQTEYFVLNGPGEWKCLPSIFFEEVKMIDLSAYDNRSLMSQILYGNETDALTQQAIEEMNRRGYPYSIGGAKRLNGK